MFSVVMDSEDVLVCSIESLMNSSEIYISKSLTVIGLISLAIGGPKRGIKRACSELCTNLRNRGIILSKVANDMWQLKS